ncbi:hypothetical protein SCA50_2463 [Salmonella enterica subsp. enterica serovar Choleraesuis str. SCSA50]|uniref:Uncharacterized protein n=1 Tax=Salmonella enterica subsp. enterica serovar Choleraesuis str. SCSA50 TaxID=904139 RepID=A0AAJ8WLN0_SALET|nr:hypothetical protein SCA50_2463 [Salmonella enterica subsp. enterica serovar Choleraesuis str. SCSA50]
MKLFANWLPFAAIARKTVQENQRGRPRLSGHVLRVQHHRWLT